MSVTDLCSITRVSLAVVLMAGGCDRSDVPHQSDAPRPASPTAASVLPAAVESTGPTAGPSDPGAETRPVSRAADADQRFLRSMADLHEGMIILAHAGMLRHAQLLLGNPSTAMSHDMSADPATLADSREDAELRQTLALLHAIYGEQYEPAVRSPVRAAADSLSAMSEATLDAIFPAQMVRIHQQGIALIDRVSPQLTREQVKALARSMRAAHQEDVSRWKHWQAGL